MPLLLSYCSSILIRQILWPRLVSSAITSLPITVSTTVKGRQTNTYTFSLDVQVLLEAIRLNSKIATSPPLSADVALQVAPPLELQSDSDLINFMRETFGVGDHVIGTAAMASKELGGVVDHTLIVYGTLNLRVIDASIFPLQLATHPQATVFAIAEKVSSFKLHVRWLTHSTSGI